MMELTTLWSLDRTIDPETGCSPIADAIAAHWDHDPGSVRFFRSSANFIYRLERDCRPAFLRIAAGSERTRPHIEGEIELLAWLTAEGIPVVQAIPARAGKMVVTVATPIGEMHAALFDALPGRLLDLDGMIPEECRTWGASVGRLHAVLSNAPDRFRGRPAGWSDALDRAESGTDHLPGTVRAEAQRLRAVLDTLPQSPETYGPIHIDLELDNLVWNDGTVAILDFDEFGDGWFMLDIAKALTDPFQEGDTADSPRIAAFLDGYRAHHPLDDAMLAHLGDFLALSELRGYMSLVRAIDMDPDDADIEWLRDLIVRLRIWM
ncbi:MAG TPA: phosphotransferase, partial [Thermomicrobiales bacterium]|nr:phosphotransferase [Thermomicrobiales bacterium]